MRNPFKFQPQHVPPGVTAPEGWSDNWLSNFMAWFSLTFLDAWCSTPEHWTSRFADWLWTDCPCCYIFRGLTLGAIFGLSVGLLLGWLL